MRRIADLLVTKAAPSELQLSWQASRSADDDDHALSVRALAWRVTLEVPPCIGAKTVIDAATDDPGIRDDAGVSSRT